MFGRLFVSLSLVLLPPSFTRSAVIRPDGGDGPYREAGAAARGEVTVRGRGKPVDTYLSRAVPFDLAGVFLVARDGEVILENGYGHADREKKIPYGPGTVFDIGSITKQFTAAAILKLEEQAKLKVSDPISKYLDGVPQDKAAITLHHLLTHTAGLEDVFGGDYEVMTRDSLVRAALGSRLLSAPGTSFRYSNSGYSLLGVVIEVVSGMPYEKFLRAQLFEPAGLKKTGYRLATWSPRELAVGYRGDARWGTPLEKAWAEDGPWWNLRANGGLLSTVGDLYRWQQALSGNKILGEASRRKLFHPHVATDGAGSAHYGYGWGVTTTPRKTRLVSHSGGNGIFFADFHRYVDEGLVVIVGTGATATPTAAARDAAVKIALGQEQPLPPAAGAAPADPGRYAGRYRTESGAEVEVALQDGRLSVRPASIGAASLLTPIPPPADAARLGPAKTRLVRIVDALAGGEPGPMLEALHGRYDPKEEAEFWKTWFGDMLKQFGEYRGVEVAGGSERDGVLTLFAAIYFDRAVRPVRGLVNPEGKIFISNSPTGTLPRSYRLAPVGPDKFSTWNFPLSRSATLAFRSEAGAARPERVEISAGGASVSAARVK